MNPDILNPEDQPEIAAVEPAPDAPAETEQSVVDIIAAAVGVDKEPEPAATPAVSDTPAPELTDEQKAKAEDERLDAEAKAFGITKPDTTTKFKELSREAARAKSELEPEIAKLNGIVEQQAARIEQQMEVFTYMEGNGVTGDQFGQAVAVLSHINSGDPVRMQRAYEALSEQMHQIGAKLGMEAPGYDPLATHADLQAKVSNLDLSREDALEIAQARQMRVAQTTHSSHQHQVNEQQHEVDAARRDLTTIEAHLRASDPLFSVKWAALGPTLVPLLSTVPLARRASAFREAYAAFQLPAAPAAPAIIRPDPGNPGRPAMGAGAKAPTNSADAIMLGLNLG